LVPSVVVELAGLPLTANGKVDRDALPVPELVGVGGRSARTPAEQVLCDLFAEVLGATRVGIDDNFFSLGGDSILSVRLVSRAREAGIMISVRGVFQHPTVAALAQIGVTEARPPAGDPAGTVPLTPMMHRSLAAGTPGPHHQSVVVPAPAAANLERLRTAVRLLVDRHDALRTRLERTGTGWRLAVAPAGGVPVAELVHRLDLTEAAGVPVAVAEAVETARRRAVDRLDPGRGRTLDVTWLDAGRAGGRLLLIAHHLVADPTSWRILLSDLDSFWGVVAAGAAPPPEPAVPFARWARLLAEQAGHRTRELPVWEQRLRQSPGSFDYPTRPPAPADPGPMRRLSSELPGELSRSLLSSLPARFHTGVEDALLTGLTVAVTRWRVRHGQDRRPLLVDLHRDGRELAGGVDFSGTAGCFTTAYPVRLDLGALDLADLAAGGTAAGQALKSVKEQIRDVPDGGLGFGLLRHLRPDTAAGLAALPPPDLAFHYLGRYDGAAAQGRWAVPESFVLSGPSASAPAGHRLMVEAWVADSGTGPVVRADWSWPAASLAGDAVRELAGGWAAALSALAAHAERPAAGGLTPSDLSLAGLSQTEIDRLEVEWRELP
jgi:non-ribosomal peptide synthase protein (TIGR01720 family)